MTFQQAIIMTVPSAGEGAFANAVGTDLARRTLAAATIQVWAAALQAQAHQIAHAWLLAEPPLEPAAVRQQLQGAMGAWAQAGPDPGARWQSGFREAFRFGYARVVLITPDCLAVTPTLLAGAFRALEETELVIGPSTEGGLWLLGMRRLHRGLLDELPYNTPALFDSLLYRIGQRSLGSVILPVHTVLRSGEDAVAILGSSYAERLPEALGSLLRKAGGIGS